MLPISKLRGLVVSLLFLAVVASLTSCASRSEVAQSTSNGDWPRTVDQAVTRLISRISPEEKRYIATRPDEDLILFHHGWGTGIRNDFGLWRGNTQLLASCGSPDMHPDDASMVIIQATWRKLRQDADPTLVREAEALRASAKAIMLKAPLFNWTPVSNAIPAFNAAAADFYAAQTNKQAYVAVEVVTSGALTPDWPVVFENPERKDASLYDVIWKISISHGFELLYEYPRIRLHREKE